MKKVITVILAMLAVCGLITGCGQGENASTGSVSTDGSTSMEKVIGYLSEAYMEDNSDVKVSYNPTGSGSGIQAVSEGRCDIGLSSRDLKEDEAKTLDATVIATDGIAVIVNPKNTVSNLTIEQIAQIYKGEVTNWKDVGGEDGPIVLIGREASSGTRDGFESITDTKEKCKYNQELTSTGDVIQTVSQNPNAIGYASLASVKDGIKVLSVDNVSPSKETIWDGSYKIQRDFVFVTKKGEKLSSDAQKFYDFATSKDADALIEKAGAIPVKR